MQWDDGEDHMGHELIIVTNKTKTDKTVQ